MKNICYFGAKERVAWIEMNELQGYFNAMHYVLYSITYAKQTLF